jgi:hypothetical protein
MSRKIAFIGIAVVFSLTVTTAAFAATGGRGGKAGTSGGSTGGGQIDPSIGIAYQSPGSITFSVATNAATGTTDLYVNSFCYDTMSQLVYSADNFRGTVLAPVRASLRCVRA